MSKILIAALILVGLIFLFGCEEGKFYIGQKVRHVTDGRVGIVKTSELGNDIYLVRFPGVEIKTHTRLLGPDQPVTFTPYIDIRCREYELEAYRK